MEHLHNMTLSTSRRRHELFDRLRAVFAGNENAELWERTSASLEHEALATHDPALARSLYRSMRRAGTWQCPTLGVERHFLRAAETLADQRRRDLLARYIHPTMRTHWLAEITAMLDRPPAETAKAEAVFEAKVRMVGELDQAGGGHPGRHRQLAPVPVPGFLTARRAGAARRGGTVADARPAVGDAGRGPVSWLAGPVGDGRPGQAGRPGNPGRQPWRCA